MEFKMLHLNIDWQKELVYSPHLLLGYMKEGSTLDTLT